MKSIYLMAAAACFLTVGITFAAVAFKSHLNDSGNNSVSSEGVSSTAAITSEKEVPEDPAGSEAGTNAQDKIIIPGYERLLLKAGTTEQSVTLYNPKKNPCYFMITILLSNGTEIYQSQLLEPGASLKKVKLSRTLSAGTYEDAVLRYSCFDLKTLKGLNGANTKLTLEVTK